MSQENNNFAFLIWFSWYFFSVFGFGFVLWDSCDRRELSKDTNTFLQFKNKDLETKYTKQRESMSSLPLVAALIVQIVASIYSSILLRSSFVHFLFTFAPVIIISPIVLISVAESFPTVRFLTFYIFFHLFSQSIWNIPKYNKQFFNLDFFSFGLQYFSDSMVRISKRFNDINILRRTAAVLTIAIVGCFNLIDMLMCASTTNQLQTNNNTSINLGQSSISYFASTVCIQFPSYFSNYAILILIATSVVVQLTHMCKFILMFIIAGN